MDYSPLQQLLQATKPKLFGDFMTKKDNYDGAICEILWMQEDTGRYWDAQWGDYRIEFKKWRSVWLDLVRYSEIVLWSNEGAKLETITLFFIPDTQKLRISEVLGVRTSKIITKLGLIPTMAEMLVHLNTSMPRSLNAQASLTIKDIKDIADFIV